MKIERDCFYKTRDGRKARVICVDASDQMFPIIALLQSSADHEYIETFTANGSVGRECNLRDDDDLVAPWQDEPKPRKLYAYQDFTSSKLLYSTIGDATSVGIRMIEYDLEFK